MRAVGFDLDGTLAVTDPDRATILRRATEAVDAPPIDRAAYSRAHRQHRAGDTRAPVFRAVLTGDSDSDSDDDTDPNRSEDDDGHDDSARGGDRDDDPAVDPERLARAYRERIERNLRPVLGAAGLVERLRERYAVGLLTDGPSRAQRGKLETLGWTDLFDATVVTGELPAGRGKPDRRAFAALLSELNADPDETVYVGDDPTADVAGATEAGLRVVQVLGPDEEPAPAADRWLRRSELADRLPAVIDDL